MSIEITTRHLETGDAIKTQAREKAAKLAEKFPEIEHIHVVLDKDGPFDTAEISVQGGRGATVEAAAKKSAVLDAIQDAFDKAESQLRKHAERRSEAKKQ
jgi:ribosomal subunit interface protein